jgi:hypothetical protein
VIDGVRKLYHRYRLYTFGFPSRMGARGLTRSGNPQMMKGKRPAFQSQLFIKGSNPSGSVRVEPGAGAMPDMKGQGWKSRREGAKQEAARPPQDIDVASCRTGWYHQIILKQLTSQKPVTNMNTRTEENMTIHHSDFRPVNTTRHVYTEQNTPLIVPVPQSCPTKTIPTASHPLTTQARALRTIPYIPQHRRF